MERIILLLFFLFSGCENDPTAWTTLFDGQKVTGMRGYKMDEFPWNSWVIENGSLKTIPHGKGVDIISTEIYKDIRKKS